MNCKRVMRLLGAFSDGELSSPRAVRDVEEHMKNCGRCGEELRKLQMMKQSLSMIGTMAVPEKLHDVVIARIENITETTVAAHGRLMNIVLDDLIPTAVVISAIVLVAVSVSLFSVSDVSPLREFFLTGMSEDDIMYLSNFIMK
jgi:anti-sigma factor RsiW